MFLVALLVFVVSFFFHDTATTEIYTLSLHDALPICRLLPRPRRLGEPGWRPRRLRRDRPAGGRSEEHTSELQSHSDLVCRLLLEKKKKKRKTHTSKNEEDNRGIDTPRAQ